MGRQAALWFSCLTGSRHEIFSSGRPGCELRNPKKRLISLKYNRDTGPEICSLNQDAPTSAPRRHATSVQRGPLHDLTMALYFGRLTAHRHQIILAMKPGMGIAIGLATGVALGIALDNLALGIAVGVALGAGLETTRRMKSKNTEDE